MARRRSTLEFRRPKGSRRTPSIRRTKKYQPGKSRRRTESPFVPSPLFRAWMVITTIGPLAALWIAHLIG